MNAAEIREALHKRWPADQYVVIEEAPDSADRMGGKLDMLAISCWRSRGYELDGVEIEISVSDWRKELAKPEKADFWWRHCHRFWLAIPSELAPKVRNELPGAWGLLAISDTSRISQLVAAPRHDAQPLTWPQQVGLLRAGQGAGLAALQRATNAGIDIGIERERAKTERQTGDAVVRKRLEELRAKVDAFTEATGIDLNHMYSEESAQEAGALYALIKKHVRRPDELSRVFENAAVQFDREAQRLRTLAEETRATVDSASARAVSA